jgi:hypothetical protein
MFIVIIVGHQHVNDVNNYIMEAFMDNNVV